MDEVLGGKDEKEDEKKPQYGTFNQEQGKIKKGEILKPDGNKPYTTEVFKDTSSAQITNNDVAKENKLKINKDLDGKRRINIDPGYLSLSKLVLLTTKDFSHRIYLGRGIYAEATLRYTNKTFQPFEWSYPDYRSDDYVGFFNKVREGYARQSRCPKC